MSAQDKVREFREAAALVPPGHGRDLLEAWAAGLERLAGVGVEMLGCGLCQAVFCSPLPPDETVAAIRERHPEMGDARLSRDADAVIACAEGRGQHVKVEW